MPVVAPLELDTLKASYLDIESGVNDDLLTMQLNAAYAFAKRYIGGPFVGAIGDPAADPPTQPEADLLDAIYTDAARRYRERDAQYGDAVDLTGDGSIVRYLRQLPPRVKAVYDLIRNGGVTSAKTISSRAIGAAESETCRFDPWRPGF